MSSMWVGARALAVIAAAAGACGAKPGPGEQLAVVERCRALVDAAATAQRLDGAAEPQVAAAAAAMDRLCLSELHEGVVSSDPARRSVVVEIMRRTPALGHLELLVASLGTPAWGDEERGRVAAALEVLTGQRLGTDAAAWRAWLGGR